VVVWNNYADTVTLDHGNRQSKDHVSSCRMEVWLYRLRRARHGCLSKRKTTRSGANDVNNIIEEEKMDVLNISTFRAMRRKSIPV
jgi:hypothetical protein